MNMEDFKTRVFKRGGGGVTGAADCLTLCFNICKDHVTEYFWQFQANFDVTVSTALWQENILKSEHKDP